MKIIKGAVIGMGKMGLVHYGILNTHPNVEIKCICDTQKIVLKYIQKENSSIQIYTDYNKMLKVEKLDFIVITTPVNFHHKIINAALNKNINIFVEKPFTINKEEGDRIINRLNESKNKLIYQVGYVNRYQEIFSKAKNILDAKTLGNLFSFNIGMFAGIVKKKKQLDKSWRSKKSIAGGGCLIEFSSHVIDLMLWYFGYPKKINEVILKKIYSDEVEDYCHISFQYKNNLFGTLTSNWSDPTYRLPLTKIEIIGDNGKLIIQDHELKLFLNDGKDNFVSGWNSIYLPEVAKSVRFDLAGSLFTLQLDDFVNNIIKNKEHNQNSFESGLMTTKLIEQIYELGSID